MAGIVAKSQTTEDEPVYKRFSVIPKFTIYKAPDSTAFTREDIRKKKPVMFMVFSPDCEHCQQETKELLASIHRFHDTQIIMITSLPFEEMMEFDRNYKIANYPQITMGRDNSYFFPVFFRVKNFPSIFLYDKKGNLQKSFEGSVSIDSLLTNQ